VFKAVIKRFTCRLYI